MRIVRGLTSYPPDAPASAIALGIFDGVHLAHRAILEAARARAKDRGLEALACTFDPHPREILQPEEAPAPITTLDERLALIGGAGIDSTVVIAFTREMASMEPEDFVRDVLVSRLKACEVVVGFNHRFGRGARGDAHLLQRLSGPLGFRAHMIPPLTIDGIAVSSSEVRTLLRRGEAERAARFLGRPYFVGGEVLRGAGRGRALGFPTANLSPNRPVLVPDGVYACHVEVGVMTYRAVVNIGVRPTFGEGVRVVEAHLLDFAGDLYGRRLRLWFALRLREERRFPDVQALRDQIARDVAAARERLPAEALYFWAGAW